MRKQQFVFDAKWMVTIDGKETEIVQMVCGENLDRAFFKARAWAKSNVDSGRFVSLVQRTDMVV